MRRSYFRLLAVGLIAAIAGAQASATPTERRLSRITIRSIGTGTPVVLIPGLASPAAVFDQVAGKISKGHRLILVQVNGFAGSPAATGRQDELIPASVDELATWLADNHIEKSAVIGHSMGGLMAMMLAQRHPDAAGRLLIVDALPFYGMLFGPTATPDAIRPVVEQMRASLVSGTSPAQLPPHMSNNQPGQAKILEWLKMSDPKTVGEALVEDATTDIRPDLPKLAGIPVTILYAVESNETKPVAEAIYREGYKSLPGAKLIAMEQSDHFIMLDQPAAFDSKVEEFLR